MGTKELTVQAVNVGRDLLLSDRVADAAAKEQGIANCAEDLGYITTMLESIFLEEIRPWSDGTATTFLRRFELKHEELTKRIVSLECGFPYTT